MSVDHREGESYPVQYSDAEWRKRLTPEQYRIMRQHGTEAPGSCALLREKRPGTFVCAGCGQPLSRSFPPASPLAADPSKGGGSASG